MDGYPRLQVFKRAAIRGEAFIHDDSTLREAIIGNLSAGGIFLGGVTEFETGTHVRITIKAHGIPEPVQALGRIVRVETKSRQGLAVEFTSISNSARERIQSCVHEARLGALLKGS